MSPILTFILWITGGLAIGKMANLEHFETSLLYVASLRILLSGGLYFAATGIDRGGVRKDWKIILLAITFGVAGKALIIGGTLALVFLHDIRYLAIGVILAQMDPLIVRALLEDIKISERAKTILLAWASYDDPVTVLISVFIALRLGLNHPGLALEGVGGYLLEMILQILFAGGISLLYVWAQKRRATMRLTIKEPNQVTPIIIGGHHIYTITSHAKRAGVVLLLMATMGIYMLLIGSISLSAYLLWMIASGIIGLFVRPFSDAFIDKVSAWSLYTVGLILGLTLASSTQGKSWDEIGMFIAVGLGAGVLAYISQLFMGSLLSWMFKLKRVDRWKIASAQQNGLTASNLALLFLTLLPGMNIVITTAIILVFLLHWGFNKVVDRYILRS